MVINPNSDEIKLLERLQIVPLNTNLPITVILNSDESCQKAPQNGDNDTPTPKVSKSKSNKQELSAAGSDGSPITIGFRSKMKENKQQQLNNVSINKEASSTTTITTTPNSPATNSTTSIIKFISKMSNKNIICKIEPVNGSSVTSYSTTTSSTEAKSSTATPTKVTASKSVEIMDFVVLNSPSTSSSTNSTTTDSKPSQIPQNLNTNITKSAINLLNQAAPNTPTHSPKVIQTNLSSTAEKRCKYRIVCIYSLYGFKLKAAIYKIEILKAEPLKFNFFKHFP